MVLAVVEIHPSDLRVMRGGLGMAAVVVLLFLGKSNVLNKTTCQASAVSNFYIRPSAMLLQGRLWAQLL